MWNRLKKWFEKTWKQLDNWPTFFLFVIVVIVMYAPVWLGILLYHLFHWHWCLWMAGAYAAFWAAPMTPFFPIAISITLAIRKIWLDLKGKLKKKPGPKSAHHSISD